MLIPPSSTRKKQLKDHPTNPMSSILTLLFSGMAVIRPGLTRLPEQWFICKKSVHWSWMTSLQPPVVPRRHNFHKERETRNHPFDSVETTNVVIASSQLLLQIKFFFGSSSLLKRIYFFPRQGQATGQPQCTLQLLLTAALGLFYYFFLILFLNYSA